MITIDSQTISLVISVLSILATVAAVFTFVNKLKWEQGQHEKQIGTIMKDVNSLGTKLAEHKEIQQSDLKVVLVRIDSIDKAVIALTVKMSYMEDMLKEIKEKLNNK